MSEETSDLRGQIKTNEGNLISISKKQNDVISKTIDLEDRSRRNNLLFFNIPESEVDKILRDYKKIKRKEKSNLSHIKKLGLLDKNGRPL